MLWKAVHLESDSLRPDILTFNAVLNSLTKKDIVPDASLQKMLSIVDYMQESGHKELQPNAYTHRCLLQAWAKSDRPEATSKAVESIKKMHALWETGDTAMKAANAHYNIAMNKLVKTGSGIANVLEIFSLLQASRFCGPDTISYTSVIEGYVKSDNPCAPEASLQLLDELTVLYDEKGDADLKPNIRTYSFVIQAMSKNPILSNVVKAREILDRLLEEYEASGDEKIRPNTIPFNYVLHCAAMCIGNEKDKLQAFQVATQTYNDLRKGSHGKPDSYTYSFWFRCCKNLLPTGELRRKCISVAFGECRKDGLVSERLLTAIPQDILVSLLEADSRTSLQANKSERLKLRDLPASWSRNASTRR